MIEQNSSYISKKKRKKFIGHSNIYKILTNYLIFHLILTIY